MRTKSINWVVNDWKKLLSVAKQQAEPVFLERVHPGRSEMRIGDRLAPNERGNNELKKATALWSD